MTKYGRVFSEINALAFSPMVEFRLDCSIYFSDKINTVKAKKTRKNSIIRTAKLVRGHQLPMKLSGF